MSDTKDAIEQEFDEAEAGTWGWDGYHTEDAVRFARHFRGQRDEVRSLLVAAEAERDRMRAALERAEGIISRFVKARDAFHYDNFGGEVERHLERAMEDAYGFLHGLPDELRAALEDK